MENVAILLMLATVYFLPTGIANMRETQNSGGIFFLNFLTGWTLIGWLICLLAACLSRSTDKYI